MQKLNRNLFIYQMDRWKKIAETGNRVIQQCDVSGMAFEVLEHMDD